MIIGLVIGLVLILLALQLFGEDEFIPNMPFDLEDAIPQLPFNLNDFPVFPDIINSKARGAGRRKRHASNTIMSDLVAGGLGVAAFAYLYSRRQPFLFVWTVIGYLLAYNSIFKTSRVLSVLVGIVLTFIVLMHPHRLFETFENEEKEPEATSNRDAEPKTNLDEVWAMSLQIQRRLFLCGSTPSGQVNSTIT
jgi:hypothetical protein